MPSILHLQAIYIVYSSIILRAISNVNSIFNNMVQAGSTTRCVCSATSRNCFHIGKHEIRFAMARADAKSAEGAMRWYPTTCTACTHKYQRFAYDNLCICCRLLYLCRKCVRAFAQSHDNNDDAAFQFICEIPSST